MYTRKESQKGGIAINYMFLLVLAILVLMVLIGFNFFLGDKLKELISGVTLPVL